METKSVIHVVATQCQPEIEGKFNRWYDETHIPMLLKCSGLKRAVRYKLLNESEDYPKYLAIYEFENRGAFKAYETSPELVAALEEMRETWKQNGYQTKWRVQYELIKTWQK